MNNQAALFEIAEQFSTTTDLFLCTLMDEIDLDKKPFVFWMATEAMEKHKIPQDGDAVPNMEKQILFLATREISKRWRKLIDQEIIIAH